MYSDAIEGTVHEISNCVTFIDGTYISVARPGDDSKVFFTMAIRGIPH